MPAIKKIVLPGPDGRTGRNAGSVEVMNSWIEGLFTSPYTPGNAGVAQPSP